MAWTVSPGVIIVVLLLCGLLFAEVPIKKQETLTIRRKEGNGFFRTEFGLNHQSEEEAFLLGDVEAFEAVPYGVFLVLRIGTRINDLQSKHTVGLVDVFFEQGLDIIKVVVEKADLIRGLE